jgi:cytochrome bd-type quinol oxidase subunit 2
MELTTVWFALIAILWAGYFLLEGFDFGVGRQPLTPEQRGKLESAGHEIRRQLAAAGFSDSPAGG